MRLMKGGVRFFIFVVALCMFLGVATMRDLARKNIDGSPLKVSDIKELLDKKSLESKLFKRPNNLDSNRLSNLSPKDTTKYATHITNIARIRYIDIPNIESSSHASFIINLNEHSYKNELNVEKYSSQIRAIETDMCDFMLVYFAGSKEGAKDVKIYQSFFNADSMDFSPPKAILSAKSLSTLSGKFIKKLGNPVSVVDSKGRVHLFVVGVSLGGWATSKIYWLMFDKNLQTLDFKKELRLNPFLNLSHLVRSGALMQENGGFILPIYYELANKFPLFLRFSSDLKNYQPLKLTSLKAQLQPSCTILNKHQSMCIYRNHKAYDNAMFGGICSHSDKSDKSTKTANNQAKNKKDTPAENYMNATFVNPNTSKCLDFKSNLKNHDASSIIFRLNNRIFLIHNLPPTTSKKSKNGNGVLESSNVRLKDSSDVATKTMGDNIMGNVMDFSNMDSTMPNSNMPNNSRGELWLYALEDMDLADFKKNISIKDSRHDVIESNTKSNTESNDMPKVKFMPLFRLDSAQGEVSYPSVASNNIHTLISYTYNRLYIRIAVIPNDMLLQSTKYASDVSAKISSSLLTQIKANNRGRQ